MLLFNNSNKIDSPKTLALKKVKKNMLCIQDEIKSRQVHRSGLIQVKLFYYTAPAVAG